MHIPLLRTNLMQKQILGVESYADMISATLCIIEELTGNMFWKYGLFAIYHWILEISDVSSIPILKTYTSISSFQVCKYFFKKKRL